LGVAFCLSVVPEGLSFFTKGRIQMRKIVRCIFLSLWILPPVQGCKKDINVPADFGTIQEAIRAVGSGQTIYLKAGVYTEALRIEKNVNIVGSDPNVVIIQYAHQIDPVISVDNSRSFHIKGVRITHVETAEPPQQYSVCYPLVRICNSTFDITECQFVGGKSNGVAIEGSSDGKIQKCLFSKNTGSGLFISDEKARVILENNQFSNNCINGIFVRKSSSITAQDNDCNNNTYNGISVMDSGSSAVLTSNKCHHNKGSGIYFGAGAAGQVQLNQCADNDFQGILVTDNGTAPTLDHNQCANNTGNGIYFDNYAQGTVTDNICSHNKWHGISVNDDNSTPALKDNRCCDNNKCGIYLSNFTHVVLYPNVVENNKEINYGYVRYLLHSRRFDDLEAMAQWLRTDHTIRSQGGQPYLNWFYLHLGTSWTGITPSKEEWLFETLDMWEKQKPDSITPLIVKAVACSSFAWYERGCGWASEVTAGGAEKFERYLQQGFDALQKVEKYKVQDPEAYNILIAISLELNKPDELIETYFNRGIKTYPSYYPLFLSRARCFQPRWGGQYGQLEKFAARAVTLTRENEGLSLYARIASDSIYGDVVMDPMKFKECGFSYEQLKQGFNDIIQRYPQTYSYPNSYCLIACFYEDKEQAKNLFEKLDKFDWDDYKAGIWVSRENYDHYRKWALSE
jgi:parallel beta-helix repeat protein